MRGWIFVVLEVLELMVLLVIVILIVFIVIFVLICWVVKVGMMFVYKWIFCIFGGGVDVVKLVLNIKFWKLIFKMVFFVFFRFIFCLLIKVKLVLFCVFRVFR